MLKVDRLAKTLVMSFQGAAEVAEMGRFVRVISSGGESYSFPVPWNPSDEVNEWENLYVAEVYHAGNVSACWSNQRLTDDMHSLRGSWWAMSVVIIDKDWWSDRIIAVIQIARFSRATLMVLIWTSWCWLSLWRGMWSHGRSSLFHIMEISMWVWSIVVRCGHTDTGSGNLARRDWTGKGG